MCRSSDICFTEKIYKMKRPNCSIAKKILWITWQDQRRNESMAREIGAQLVNLHLNRYPRVIRILKGILSTVFLFHREKPETVIVQNPSFMLALTAVLCKSIFRYRIGIDTHNSGFGLYRDYKWLHSILLFIQTRADFIIAHNDELRRLMEKKCHRIVALPDPIPVIPETDRLSLNGRHNVLFVCRFNDDEPYDEVIKAAKKLPNDILVYISGNYKDKINLGDVHINVRLLEWIGWEEYNAYLWSVDAIMVLTKREHCLLCGAYEAVSVSKPLITSNTETLKGYFSSGSIYVRNDSNDIAAAILSSFERKTELETGIAQLKTQLIKDWHIRKTELLKLL